jgi:small subunit ribosomal protein S28e
MANPRNDKRQGSSQKTQSSGGSGVNFTQGFPARVEEVIGRTGARGDVIQVRCKILAGYDQNKIIRRNVVGPVQMGDILMLRETEIEARPLNHRRK